MLNFEDKIYFEEPVLDRFFNGVSPFELVTAKIGNRSGIINLMNLFASLSGAERLVSKDEGIWVKDVIEEVIVADRGGSTKVIQVMRRKVYEKVFEVVLSGAKTTVSMSHSFLVFRNDDEILLRASELVKNDKLLVLSPANQPEIQEVEKVQEVKPSFNYLYGLVTKSHSCYLSWIFGKSY